MFYKLSTNMGIILNKLFGQGGPVLENHMDIRCCDTTEILSAASSSSSSESEHRTHESAHVASRPSFETMPPTPQQLRREITTVRYNK